MDYAQILRNLKDPDFIKRLLLENGVVSTADNVSIKVQKDYLDERSYSLVALYEVDGRKIVGVANSDGRKLADFKACTHLAPFFDDEESLDISPPLFYHDELQIFFRG
jgi:hypothetical protein